MTKKIIGYFDMDGPLADFELGINRHVGHPERGVWSNDPPEMFEKYFFRDLPVTEGAKVAVSIISKLPNIEMWIATKNVNHTAFYSATEKMEWLDFYFPDLVKRTHLTQDKGQLNGHFLIDDHKERWQSVFNGDFYHFDVKNPLDSWKEITSRLVGKYGKH